MKTAFQYNMELSNINDENIKALDEKLGNIDSMIKFSYEEEGKNGKKPLPDVYQQVLAFIKKHGGGKFFKQE